MYSFELYQPLIAIQSQIMLGRFANGAKSRKEEKPEAIKFLVYKNRESPSSEEQEQLKSLLFYWPDTDPTEIKINNLGLCQGTCDFLMAFGEGEVPVTEMVVDLTTEQLVILKVEKNIYFSALLKQADNLPDKALIAFLRNLHSLFTLRHGLIGGLDRELLEHLFKPPLATWPRLPLTFFNPPVVKRMGIKPSIAATLIQLMFEASLDGLQVFAWLDNTLLAGLADPEILHRLMLLKTSAIVEREMKSEVVIGEADSPEQGNLFKYFTLSALGAEANIEVEPRKSVRKSSLLTE